MQSDTVPIPEEMPPKPQDPNQPVRIADAPKHALIELGGTVVEEVVR